MCRRWGVRLNGLLSRPGSELRHDVGQYEREHAAGRAAEVLIEKERILAILRSRGQDIRADWVDRELQDEVDTDHHAGLLATLHLTPADLAEKPEESP